LRGRLACVTKLASGVAAVVENQIFYQFPQNRTFTGVVGGP
jgi:hypothetical protein